VASPQRPFGVVAIGQPPTDRERCARQPEPAGLQALPTNPRAAPDELGLSAARRVGGLTPPHADAPTRVDIACRCAGNGARWKGTESFDQTGRGPGDVA
jgi:hypothetical protein